ncbi:MAG: hypothetical protein WCX74_00310 [Candidatus Paceibacterota bacterium]
MFPIERPEKSGSIGASRSEGGSFNHGAKHKKEEKPKKRFGWNYSVAPKPKSEQVSEQNKKYMNSLSNIKNKARGIDTKKNDSVVKPWDFNFAKGDSSQARYGSALANLKNSIKKKD